MAELGNGHHRHVNLLYIKNTKIYFSRHLLWPNLIMVTTDTTKIDFFYVQTLFHLNNICFHPIIVNYIWQTNLEL